MEENENVSDAPHVSQEPDACISCGNPHYEDGFANKLCTDCRNKYAKFPIPKWIQAFAAGILVLVVFGMARLYQPLVAAIALKRAIKAEEQHKFITANREIKKVLAVFPESVEANAHAFLADFYTMDLASFGDHMTKISDKQIEDKELLAKLDYVAGEATALIPKDTTIPKALDRIPVDSIDRFESFMRSCQQSDSNDMCVRYLLADRLYDMKLYERSEKMVKQVLDAHPDFPGGLPLLCADLREEAKYEEALAVCDKQQKSNIESSRPNAQKARVELKRKDDAAAAKYIEQALKLESNEPYVLETLAMLDFYTGKKEESMKLLTRIRELEKPSTSISERLEAILSGKVNFR